MPRARLAVALPQGSPRSRYWSFATGASNRDLYVAREGSGQWAHISLHGAHDWHLALPHQETYLDVGVAPEVSSGVRHALSVVIAPSGCTILEPAPAKVTVVRLRQEEPLRCGSFDLFLVDAGADVRAGGSAPNWRQPLGGDGATVQIFARAIDVPAIAFDVEGPPERIGSALEEVAAGKAEALHVMQSSGGPVVILEGRLELSS